MTDANRPTDPVSLPMDVKRKLLAARDALTVGDVMEAYHQIYSIASPHFNKLADEVWTALETVTPASPGGAGTKPVQQWAVFCDSCEATWSVQHYHAGKDRCEKCRRSSGVARVEQDAARYQFLRGLHDPGPNDPRVHTLDQQHDPVQVRLCFGDELDAAVDAAMRQP